MSAIDKAERRRVERLLWGWGTALTGMPSGGGVGDPTASAVQMRDDAMRRVNALAEEINAIMARKAGVTAETLVLEKAERNQRRREMLEALTGSRMKQLALHAKRKRIRKKHADRLLRRE